MVQFHRNSSLNQPSHGIKSGFAVFQKTSPLSAPKVDKRENLVKFVLISHLVVWKETFSGGHLLLDLE